MHSLQPQVRLQHTKKISRQAGWFERPSAISSVTSKYFTETRRSTKCSHDGLASRVLISVSHGHVHRTFADTLRARVPSVCACFQWSAQTGGNRLANTRAGGP